MNTVSRIAVCISTALSLVAGLPAPAWAPLRRVEEGLTQDLTQPVSMSPGNVQRIANHLGVEVGQISRILLGKNVIPWWMMVMGPESIGRRFQMTQVVLKDGRSFIGVLTRESPDTVLEPVYPAARLPLPTSPECNVVFLAGTENVQYRDPQGCIAASLGIGPEQVASVEVAPGPEYVSGGRYILMFQVTLRDGRKYLGQGEGYKDPSRLFVVTQVSQLGEVRSLEMDVSAY